MLVEHPAQDGVLPIQREVRDGCRIHLAETDEKQRELAIPRDGREESVRGHAFGQQPLTPDARRQRKRDLLGGVLDLHILAAVEPGDQAVQVEAGQPRQLAAPCRARARILMGLVHARSALPAIAQLETKRLQQVLQEAL